jgi:hypothetical protein
MSLLDPIPGIVAGALAPVMKRAALFEPGVPVSDGRGGRTAGTPIEHSCAALGLDYSDALRSLSNGAIEINDRKLIVMAASLPVTLRPRRGWKVSAQIDGVAAEDWTVIAVKRDPAGATFELQLRPA